MSFWKHRGTGISLLRTICLNSDKTPCSKFYCYTNYSSVQNCNKTFWHPEFIYLCHFPYAFSTYSQCLFYIPSGSFVASFPRQQQQHQRQFLGTTAPSGHYFYYCKYGLHSVIPNYLKANFFSEAQPSLQRTSKNSEGSGIVL